MSEWRNYMQLSQMKAKKKCAYCLLYIFLIYKKRQNGNKVE